MIVITAAGGRLGRAVAAALEQRIAPAGVRLAARAPEKLADLEARGFQIARADYDDPDTLAAALAGADSLVLISSMGVDADRLRHHRNAIEAAERAGVRRIVYTSATHPTLDSRFEWAGAHRETEAALKASRLAWTVLRDNAYAANNAALYAQARSTGVLALPGPDAKVAYVTHEDVAAALAGVLTTAGHEGRTYEITGPEALDGHQVAALLAQVYRRDVRAVDVPLADFADGLRAAGLPEFVVTGVTSFHAALAAGEYAAVSDDVARLAGRPATPLADYLARLA
ncbi:SDR family oxidoreductase [Dokdonella koreensis]|uniref:Nucleoside-diphosphate-sugar epimerase n=1 Tax=Dokdonella koreensis DS-123 TaxID=1300342 RepID=A0A167G3Y6_9GAMM|nr:SDR family oxidoreductase [Dokdonella koreensis]ANB16133.1 Putative nucleoside-diphosphate-sugar epimerase [Dokdonella koreensis DS-123]